jgi:tRNA (adenine57-N1/adenine58-N1)-methyltransferase catalytic subunit
MALAMQKLAGEGQMRVTREGDLVQLIGRDRKRFILRLRAGGRLQTHRGYIDHDDLLGQATGREVRSHLGYPFVALEPSTCELIEQLKRTTQIMYPKDIGYSLLKLNVMPGSHIIEAGTGSGGLTLALARAVQPSGCVFSYEARAEILAVAQRNVEMLGLSEHVHFRLRDIAEGFDETEVDAVFLDVRRPWAYLEQTTNALKDSGFFGAILPTTNQVAALTRGLEVREAYGQIEIEEIMLRPYKAVPDRLRPMDRMVAHTGYLVFARKVRCEVTRGGYWEDRRRRKHEETAAAGIAAEAAEDFDDALSF